MPTPPPDDDQVRAILHDAEGLLATRVRLARSQGVDPRSLVFVVGAPRFVARLAARTPVCDCPVIDVTHDRARLAAIYRKAGHTRLADRLDEALAEKHLRVVVVTRDNLSVVTLSEPGEGLARAHACEEASPRRRG
jgi:hypothetical protein